MDINVQCAASKKLSENRLYILIDILCINSRAQKKYRLIKIIIFVENYVYFSNFSMLYYD